MVMDVKPSLEINKDEIHGNKEWARYVSKQSRGLGVVFLNSYQWASKYWFYAGQPSLSMNTPYYRRNNYNYWPIEDDYFGKPAFVIGDYDTVVLKNEIYAPRIRRTGSAVIPVFFSFMKAQFSHVKYEATAAGITTSFKVEVPDKYLSCFQNQPFDTASVQLAILNMADTIRYFPSTVRVKQIVKPSFNLSINFQLQLPKGVYDARLGISSGVPGHPTLNSPSFRITIE
jgi:hypothetical protein